MLHLSVKGKKKGIKIKKYSDNVSATNYQIFVSKRATNHLTSIQSYRGLISNHCISPADKVCACRPSGNMCFLKLPHVRLALRKYVNKHNKTPPSHICQWKGIALLAWALHPWLCEGSKKLIINWRHVVEHFPNVFCLFLPHFLLPDFSGCCFILLPKLSFSSSPVVFFFVFLFFAMLIFLRLLNYVSMGRKSHFFPACLPWIVLTVLQKHITKHN